MTFIKLPNEPDQEERLAKLRAEVEKLGGTAMTLQTIPADMEEEFLRHVLEYETAQPVSLLTRLANSALKFQRRINSTTKQFRPS